ncbi:unnamed protein product [Gadus morhua 'NCC']
MMYSPITARIIFHGDFTTGDWELNPSAQLATLNLNSFVRLGFEQGKLFILGMKSLPLGLESGLHLESVHARHCVLKR